MPYLTGRRPSQELAIQIRLSQAYERSMQASVEREVSRAVQQAADALEQGAPVEIAMQQHQSRMASVYRSMGESVLPEFGGRILSAAGKSWRAHLRTKGAQEQFDAATRAYLETLGARAVLASETTQAQIRAAITAGEADGLSQARIAAQIRQGVPDLQGTGFMSPRVRSLVIARTEVHTAAQVANHEAAMSTGVVQEREWVAAEDARTRASHNAADGDRVAPGGMFDVGGASLKFPGDPSGPARETVNCRCATVFIT